MELVGHLIQLSKSMFVLQLQELIPALALLIIWISGIVTSILEPKICTSGVSPLYLLPIIDSILKLELLSLMLQEN